MRILDTGGAGTLLLGWGPTVPLRAGLAKTIEYFDKLIASKNVV